MVCGGLSRPSIVADTGKGDGMSLKDPSQPAEAASYGPKRECSALQNPVQQAHAEPRTDAHRTPAGGSKTTIVQGFAEKCASVRSEEMTPKGVEHVFSA